MTGAQHTTAAGEALSICAAAAEAPDRVGLIITSPCHSRARAYTFAELAARTRGIMEAMATHAARRGVPIASLPLATVATPTLDTVLLLYAALELGATCALLHPRSTAAERAARLALCHALPPARAGRPRVVVFTSGTASSGKGVVLGGDAFVASAAGSAANLGWRDDDRWLCCLPLAHVGGLSILLRCLIARRCAVLDQAARFDPGRIAARIEDTHATLLSLVPTMLTRLLDAGWTAPAHLRAVLLGGAAASPALLARAADRGVPALATYGMTETCSQVCTQPYGTRPAADGAMKERMGELMNEPTGMRIGPPIPGAEVRIAGGRIQVRGPMLLDTYLGAPTPVDADGWLDTGDRGTLDTGGALRVLGRADDVIITGGENVHPGEIEPAIAAHPAVAATCVFGVADATWGQVVAAAVALRDGTALTPDALAQHLAPRLPAHKYPRRLAVLAHLALNANGKPDRARIARDAAAHLVPLQYPPK